VCNLELFQLDIAKEVIVLTVNSSVFEISWFSIHYILSDYYNSLCIANVLTTIVPSFLLNQLCDRLFSLKGDIELQKNINFIVTIFFFASSPAYIIN